jgi:hypothetical protein
MKLCRLPFSHPIIGKALDFEKRRTTRSAAKFRGSKQQWLWEASPTLISLDAQETIGQATRIGTRAPFHEIRFSALGGLFKGWCFHAGYAIILSGWS